MMSTMTSKDITMIDITMRRTTHQDAPSCDIACNVSVTLNDIKCELTSNNACVVHLQYENTDYVKTIRRAISKI